MQNKFHMNPDAEYQILLEVSYLDILYGKVICSTVDIELELIADTLVHEGHSERCLEVQYMTVWITFPLAKYCIDDFSILQIVMKSYKSTETDP